MRLYSNLKHLYVHIYIYIGISDDDLSSHSSTDSLASQVLVSLEYLLDQGGKQTFFLVQKIKYMLSIWDRNHMDLYEEYGKGNMGVKPRNVDDGREPEEGERDADR